MFNRIRLSIVLLLVVFSMIQCALDQDSANVFSVIFAFSGSVVCVFALLQERIFREFPISSLQILVFALGNLSIPLVATTLEGHPLVYNLAVPTQTFGWLAAIVLVLVLTHWLYRSSKPLRRLRSSIVRRVHLPMGLFVAPTANQLWVLGFIGCLATCYVTLVLPDAGVGASPVNKVVEALEPFSYAPFLTALTFLYTERRPVTARQIASLAVYFAFIIGIGMARNSRGTFAECVFTLGMAIVLGLLTRRLPVSALKAKIVLPVVVGGMLLASVMSDLAVSMAIARQYRGQVSSSEMISRSLATFSDKPALAAFKENSSAVTDGWNEAYLKNPFLGRFVEVKYHDNILNLVDKFNEGETRDLDEFSLQRLWAGLPEPLLTLVSSGVDKSRLHGMTSGDYIYYLCTHDPTDLGPNRTGSFIGEGIARFDICFLPTLGLVFLLTFPLMDSFVLPVYQDELPEGAPRRTVIFSVAVLTNLFPVVNYISQESMNTFFQYFMRGFAQTVIVYAILFLIIRRLPSKQ